MNRIFLLICACISAFPLWVNAQSIPEGFKSWASTPPMGWNSWDCYGPTVTENEVKSNADYMSKNLKDYGWNYIVVDIRWYVSNDKAGGYNQTNPIYNLDEWGRYIPAPNRFPSSENGNGFKPLAEYVHDLGLKFGIHLMRGIPKEAVAKKMPVKGAAGITADMISNNDSTCTWLRDNMKVDWRKAGAQEYYNSLFDMYADWGVDFVKIDDLSRPYHTAEIEMIRNAIDQCGRPIVLSISPGETPIDRVDHVRDHANMWRTVDDFWDNWSQLNYQFGICAKWAPYIAPGTWPDADMLPLGKISIRGERGAERFTNFTPDEQKTMMNLWTIFKSPLMFGGDLPQNDEATNSLLTNKDVLYMHSHSVANKEVSNLNNHITWSAIDPRNGDCFVALFNTGGNEFLASKDALWRSGTISYLTTGYSTQAVAEIPKGSRQLVLAVTDGGDGFDSDHADWIEPKVKLDDGTFIDLTELPVLKKTAGWGEVHVNSNLNGGKLKIDGKEYEKGIATHANSILIFEIPENAVEFTAIAGLDNTGTDQGSKSSVEFMVFNYDPTYRYEFTDQWNAGNIEVKIDPTKQIATSGYICRDSSSPVTEIEAKIEGAEKLYLVVTNGGDDFSYDHADWVNPTLIDKEGNEVSLTTIKWDDNPVNGWNNPKVNKNNDGNTLSIGGESYELGFGVNAPSVLTFTLPENHNFVYFRSLAGLDNDVDNAPGGATVEFRVFTEDPAPNNEANVKLDLSKLGFDENAVAKVRDMWSGEELGTFEKDSFAPLLKEHASGLYRVTPMNREGGVSLNLSAKEDADKGEITLSVELIGGDPEDGYVQFTCDDDIIGALPFENESKISFVYPSQSGDHKYKAYYSGTLKIDKAVSNEVEINSTGSVEGLLKNPEISITTQANGVVLSSEKDLLLPIYNLNGDTVKIVKVGPVPLLVSLESGIYLIASRSYLVK